VRHTRREPPDRRESLRPFEPCARLAEPHVRLAQLDHGVAQLLRSARERDAHLGQRIRHGARLSGPGDARRHGLTRLSDLARKLRERLQRSDDAALQQNEAERAEDERIYQRERAEHGCRPNA
jgi:hypothetical protein